MLKIWEEYTKSKYNGYVLLALAVIKQWVIDGKPRGDRKGLQPWIDLVKLHMPEANIDQFIKASASIEV